MPLFSPVYFFLFCLCILFVRVCVCVSFSALGPFPARSSPPSFSFYVGTVSGKEGSGVCSIMIIAASCC